jgi:hypothetical protein
LQAEEKDVTQLSFTELSNYMYEPGGGENLKGKIEILSASGQTYENKQKSTFLESFV